MTETEEIDQNNQTSQTGQTGQTNQTNQTGCTSRGAEETDVNEADHPSRPNPEPNPPWRPEVAPSTQVVPTMTVIDLILDARHGADPKTVAKIDELLRDLGARHLISIERATQVIAELDRLDRPALHRGRRIWG